MPNLNGRRFLPERLRTIAEQTFSDWELVVVDSYSEDGAWEYLLAESAAEPRMHIYQAPREGIYPAMNRCISLAQGEFIYIATSDDTMPSDCLEKLLAALESNPDCDIAHCPLRVIDEVGKTVKFNWERASVFARSSGQLLDRLHIRRAPFDGLLHLGGESVYISLTQLLLRRSLFERVGLFNDQWGGMGDFNWVMRATLLANTVHVPTTWGGWRIHAAQATNLEVRNIPSERRKIENMIDHALEVSRAAIPADVNRLLQDRRQYFWQRWEFDHLLRERKDRTSRIRFLLKNLIERSVIAWCYLGRRLRGLQGWNKAPIEVLPRWLSALGYVTIEDVKSQKGSVSPPPQERATE